MRLNGKIKIMKKIPQSKRKLCKAEINKEGWIRLYAPNGEKIPGIQEISLSTHIDDHPRVKVEMLVKTREDKELIPNEGDLETYKKAYDLLKDLYRKGDFYISAIELAHTGIDGEEFYEEISKIYKEDY